LAGRKRKSWKHLLTIFTLTFLIAAVVGGASELLMRYTTLALAWLILLLVILIHILFDIVGIAATAASEAPHHARAANKVHGARQSVFLVRNADLVANFANDIVGDVTGTLSGAMAASIVLDIMRYYPGLAETEIWLNTLMLALVASITVTGKAVGKSLAIREANEIIGLVGGILASVEQVTGWSLTVRTKRGGKKHGPARKDS